MAENRIEYTAKVGMVTISTANSNLNGEGTLGTVLTGDGSGVRLTRVYIKAIGDVTQGTVRLFLYNGSTTKLVREIPIPTVDSRQVTPAFTAIVKFKQKVVIPNGWILKASTENAEAFNIVAEGSTWSYPVSLTKIEITGAIANTTVSTANSNLDGTGTLSTVISGSNNGKKIESIMINATGSTTIGMIRLFMYDGTNTKLFMEIPVPTSVQSSVVPAFSKVVNFRSGLMIPNGWSVKASTQNAETFIVTANAFSFDYV